MIKLTHSVLHLWKLPSMRLVVVKNKLTKSTSLSNQVKMKAIQVVLIQDLTLLVTKNTRKGRRRMVRRRNRWRKRTKKEANSQKNNWRNLLKKRWASNTKKSLEWRWVLKMLGRRIQLMMNRSTLQNQKSIILLNVMDVELLLSKVSDTSASSARTSITVRAVKKNKAMTMHF